MTEIQAEIKGHGVLKSALSFLNVNSKWILTGIYFLLSLSGIWHHEIWLDEAQHFLLARDSSSFNELIYNCRMEGHPLLWNMLLFIVTRFSDDVIYMQMLHIMISTLLVFFIAGTDLKLYEKVFILLSYFIFYEYNIISRNYGITALLMMLIAISFYRKKIKIISLAILLMLLTQTHLYGLLFSFAFLITLLRYDRNYLRGKKPELILAVCIYLSGLAFAIASIIPPGNYTNLFMQYDSSGLFSSERFVKIFSVVLKGIFYLPDYSNSINGIENSSFIFDHGLHESILFLVSAIALLTPVVLFRKNKWAASLYIFYFLIYTACNYFLPLVNGVRYYGFFFIVFIICYMISRKDINKRGRIIANCIFVLQAFNGIYFYMADLNLPFSVSEQTSAYLEKNLHGNTHILILEKTIRPAISAYTGEKYFGIETGGDLSYCLWMNKLNEAGLKIKTDSLLNSHEETFIITKETLPAYINRDRLEYETGFSHSMLKNESVSIYRYRRTAEINLPVQR